MEYRRGDHISLLKNRFSSIVFEATELWFLDICYHFHIIDEDNSVILKFFHVEKLTRSPPQISFCAPSVRYSFRFG